MNLIEAFFGTSTKKGAVSVQSQSEPIKASTQDLIPIADIEDGVVYRQDDKMVVYVRIQPINISLMSENEKTMLCNSISEATNSIDFHYQYYCCERPIDLNQYVEQLHNLRGLDKDSHQRSLLERYTDQALTLSSSGETREKRFYIIMTSPGKDRNADYDLITQANLLIQNLKGAKVDCYRAKDQEIIEVLTLYTRPQTTDFAVEFDRADVPMHT